MNEELKNRFEALSSSSENKKLSWAAMGPAINDALNERKKKRRALLWWWVGGVFASLFIAFFAIQNQLPNDAVASRTTSPTGSLSSTQDLSQDQSAKTGFGEDQHSLQIPSGSGEMELQKGAVLRSDQTSAFAKTIHDSNASSTIFNDFSRAQPSDSPSNSLGFTQRETIEQIAESQLGVHFEKQQSKPVISKLTPSSFNSTSDVQGVLELRDLTGIADVSFSQLQGEGSTEVLPKGEQGSSPIVVNVAHGKLLDFLPSKRLNLLAMGPVHLDAFDFSKVVTPAKDGKAALKSSASTLSLTAFSGGHFTNAAAAYKQMEDFLGWTAGLGLEYELPNGWFGGLGCRVDETRFSTSTTLVDTVRAYRPGQISRVYTFSGNRVILEYSDTISVQKTRRVNNNNTQTDLVLPVYLGYRWHFGKWEVGVHAGVNAFLSQYLRGKLLSDQGQIVVVDQRNRQVRFMPQVGAALTYEVSDRINVSLVGARNQSVGVSSTALEAAQRFWASQLNIGLRYSIHR